MTDDNRHWLQVGEFVANFGGNELPAAAILAGRSLQLSFEDGTSEKYRFLSGDQLEVSDAGNRSQTVSYRATQLRNDVVLVDYLPAGQPTRSVSIVIDLVRKICTKVAGQLPTREQALVPIFTRVLDKQSLSAVQVTFVHGAVDAPFGAATPRHAPTDDLVGRRVHHEYGNADGYEHIYLERDLYTWHCTKGPEVGLADTDRCFMYKLADELYLFVWIEKIIPTLGVLMMDQSAWRTTGKLFGYRGGDFGETVNSAVGAVSKLMNVTRY